MPLGGLRKFRPGFFFIFGLGTSGIYIYIFFYIRQPRRNQTLWDKSEVKRWEHDRYVEAEQGPKEEWEKMVIPAVLMFSFILSLCQH